MILIRIDSRRTSRRKNEKDRAKIDVQWPDSVVPEPASKIHKKHANVATPYSQVPEKNAKKCLGAQTTHAQNQKIEYPKTRVYKKNVSRV